MQTLTKLFLFLSLIVLVQCNSSSLRNEDKQTNDNFSVIAYYMGDSSLFKEYPTQKLTHIIFSFLHLKGDSIAFDKREDSITVAHLVSLKQDNPQLKILLSLGGWGGCETCSDVFSTEKGRNTFSKSVKQILINTKTDGIDLDWEYPAIIGLPEHKFMPEDRHNFTLLVQNLRKELGNEYEISFAAGGYTEYLENSIEWPEVMAVVDRVNLMSYDLTNGYSTTTGHHTPLYSTPKQKESTNHGVHFLDSIGIPSQKIIIGAAFYARIFKDVTDSLNNGGLNQKCIFKTAINYKDFEDSLFYNNNFIPHWDSIAQAPYAYNKTTQEFATYDNPLSIELKTQYAINKKLGGIMFWELTGDKKSHGLIDVIDYTLKRN